MAGKGKTQPRLLYFGGIGLCLAKSGELSVSQFQERFEVSLHNG